SSQRGRASVCASTLSACSRCPMPCSQATQGSRSSSARERQGSSGWRRSGAASTALQLGPNHSRGSRQRCQLPERLLTRQVLHAAVGCEDEAFRLDMLQRAAYALDDGVHILDWAVVGEVDDADDQLLVLEV